MTDRTATLILQIAVMLAVAALLALFRIPGLTATIILGVVAAAVVLIPQRRE